MLVFIWRMNLWRRPAGMEPRPAGGQEEGYMFWSAHSMNGAPNSELDAQITSNPFRLTVSISLDFPIGWWVRTYCTDPPINVARSRRQNPPWDRQGSSSDRQRTSSDRQGHSSDRHESTLRPKKALQRPTEPQRPSSGRQKRFLYRQRPCHRQGPPKALAREREREREGQPPQTIFFNGYKYTCLSVNRSESRIVFFVLVIGNFRLETYYYCCDRSIKYCCWLHL